MLKKILGTIGEEEFFTKYWGQKNVVLSDSIKENISFSKDDFFKILDTCNLEFPRVTCLHHRGRVPVEEYVDITTENISSKILSDKVKKLAEKGNTVRIRGIDQFNDSIKLLKNKMIEVFRFNVTANAYYSSSPANGMNPHYDIRHIFIVQLEGVKEWSVGDKINQIPRNDFRPFIFTDMDSYEAKETFSLNAGEVLYIPPGLWHKTSTLEPNYSLHIALGITMADWYDMSKVYLIHLMKKFPIFREHVPFKIQDGMLNFQENLIEEMLSLIELIKTEVSNYDFYKDIEDEVRKKP